MNLVSNIAEVGAWTCLLAVAYVYIGYPLTLWAWPSRRRAAPTAASLPRVTVVIAAFDEARHIEGTIRNKLAQDYPEPLLDVVVISDGLTDGTDAIVTAINEPRVTLLRQQPRQGKTLALNRGVGVARGEIVVFSDANSQDEPATVRHLASAFADPDVGYATGSLVYEAPRDSAVGEGSGLYMRYESWLRRQETRVGSVVGVNGGVDAVRRSLYQPMRADHLPDFVLPLRVVQQGFRVIECEQAVAREQALGRQADEFRMRVRVSLRALHGIFDMRSLLHPRHGLFAFQLFVHKVLRYLTVLFLAGALAFSAALIASPFYRAFFFLQVACYGLAAVGWLSGGRIRFRPIFVPFYFCLINLAAGVAFIGFIRGQRQILWTPRKGA